MTEENKDNNEATENTESTQTGSSESGVAPRIAMTEGPRGKSLEVTVDPNQNIEKAMKILKRKLIKEGLFKELKLRRYYEKPSERRKRKHKDSMKKIRKEEARSKKNPYLYY